MRTSKWSIWRDHWRLPIIIRENLENSRHHLIKERNYNNFLNSDNCFLFSKSPEISAALATLHSIYPSLSLSLTALLPVLGSIEDAFLSLQRLLHPSPSNIRLSRCFTRRRGIFVGVASCRCYLTHNQLLSNTVNTLISVRGKTRMLSLSKEESWWKIDIKQTIHRQLLHCCVSVLVATHFLIKVYRKFEI